MFAERKEQLEKQMSKKLGAPLEEIDDSPKTWSDFFSGIAKFEIGEMAKNSKLAKDEIRKGFLAKRR